MVATCAVKNDGFLNLRDTHWFYRREHKQRWCIGANWFSFWRQETMETWNRNWEILKEFEEVETGTSFEP